MAMFSNINPNMSTTMNCTFIQRLIVFVFLLGISIPSMSQNSETCGTENMDSLAAISQPYYGNNQFLINLADSVENSGCSNCRTTAGGIATEAYVMPVKIWVYRTDAGAGGIDNERAERLINLTNRALAANRVRIRLYISGEMTRINNTNHYENINGKQSHILGRQDVILLQ